MKTNRKFKKAGFALMFIAVAAGVVALIMFLWNALIPQIVGWQTIGYWQAAGLLLLCRLLLGGFGHAKHAGMMCGHKHKHEDFKRMRLIHDKMSCMSHEERREFIRKRFLDTEDEQPKNEQ